MILSRTDGDPTPQFARLPVALIRRARSAGLPGDALYTLVYLHSLIDHRSGELPKDAVYQHKHAAEWTGCGVSTIRTHLAELERCGLVKAWRVYRGLRFRILGLTFAAPGKRQILSTHSGERQIPSTSETQAPAIQPVNAGIRALPIDSENPEKGGGAAAAVGAAAPQTPPPQILIYDEVFRPKREKPLEPWRWSCITSVVGLDPRSLEGWRRACERWLGNNQDAEKVVTLVTSYREKFQPQVGPGSPGRVAAAAPPPVEELRPPEPVRILGLTSLRDAIKHRDGPLKEAIAGVLASAEVMA